MGLPAPRYEDAPGMTLVGYSEKYTLESKVKIPEQWSRFSHHFGKVPGQQGPATYGVSSNYQQGEGFDYLTCVEVDPAVEQPAEFTTLTLEPRRYAVIPHNEHVMKIPETFEAIWRKWLPESGLKTAAAPCFERYAAEFNPHTGMGGMEIWIPLAC